MFVRWGAKTVPLRAPNYGQPNNSPRGAVSAEFFLSVGIDIYSKHIPKESLARIGSYASRLLGVLKIGNFRSS